eukprot:7389310-Prymnesium_polylepis.1
MRFHPSLPQPAQATPPLALSCAWSAACSHTGAARAAHAPCVHVPTPLAVEPCVEPPPKGRLARWALLCTPHEQLLGTPHEQLQARLPVRRQTDPASSHSSSAWYRTLSAAGRTARPAAGLRPRSR